MVVKPHRFIFGVQSSNPSTEFQLESAGFIFLIADFNKRNEKIKFERKNLKKFKKKKQLSN